jgi:hypothetical protein
MRWSSLQVGLVAVGVSACGHLNDADYEGEPQFRVDGRIVDLAPPIQDAASYVTVMWGPFLFGAGTPGGVADVDPIDFPAPFALTVYDVPGGDNAILIDPDDPASAWYAIGDILVFEDIDGNQQFTPEFSGGLDRSRGDTATEIVYAHAIDDDARAFLQREPFPAFANPEALVDGFQLARYGADTGWTLLPATAEVTIEPVLPPPADPL